MSDQLMCMVCHVDDSCFLPPLRTHLSSPQAPCWLLGEAHMNLYIHAGRTKSTWISGIALG